MAGVVLLTGGGDELHESLPRVPAFAHDEVPEVARLVGLVVRDEPLPARPLANRVPNRVPELRRQPAALDLEHLVPSPRLVEPERRPVLELRERVLELVPVMKDVLGTGDRLHRRRRDAADPPQRILDLPVLGRDLCFVPKILEPTAPTGRVVRARRLDTLRPRLEHLRHERLRVAALDLRHAGPHRVTRQATPDEHDEPVQPRDPVAAVGERVDRELELLVLGHRRGHAPEGSWCPCQ